MDGESNHTSNLESHVSTSLGFDTLDPKQPNASINKNFKSPCSDNAFVLQSLVTDLSFKGCKFSSTLSLDFVLRVLVTMRGITSRPNIALTLPVVLSRVSTWEMCPLAGKGLDRHRSTSPNPRFWYFYKTQWPTIFLTFRPYYVKIIFLGGC